jgi:hypothetical protein
VPDGLYVVKVEIDLGPSFGNVVGEKTIEIKNP